VLQEATGGMLQLTRNEKFRKIHIDLQLICSCQRLRGGEMNFFLCFDENRVRFW
jgi:hypothetical protein